MVKKHKKNYPNGLNSRQSDLNRKQEKQIRLQLKNHEHDQYEVDIELAPAHFLKGFSVNKGVFRPDVTVSVYLTRWLFFNNGEYRDKQVIDCGCGSGIQGITAAKYGAAHVTAVDISEVAIDNTLENIRKQGLEQKMTVNQSDLFEKAEGLYDYIIFNHPFFPGEPIDEKPVSRAMLGGKELIHRFLKEAHSYLENEGCIIMPYFHLAGDANNPAVQGPKHGYDSMERFSIITGEGLQQGRFSVYELRRTDAVR